MMVISQQKIYDSSRDFSGIAYPLLDELSKDESLRNNVLNYDPVFAPNVSNEILSFFQENVNTEAFGYSVEICEIGGGCAQVEFDCTCPGDINLDGTVDPLDSGSASSRYGCDVSDEEPACENGGEADEQQLACDNADANNDGVVDPLDGGYIIARYGQVCAEPIETLYPPENVELHVAQRIISTTITRQEFDPRKIKIWLWVK